uniref:Uncharacterized protein n=1 Tax=Candidatus Kentrum sp. UNK TaxID=2126344 RepID=A0A450ZXE6_9GAMM|nr:MAG: hypothetical protein BECKUNK1418G_GA0071005_100337 [Candidatus Kentron sp. UNK]VFK71637.1 MAG: hypothetical protein BECKUNK1418H_GA0071006_107515 [Candidatus Kentron sp. UNK]
MKLQCRFNVCYCILVSIALTNDDTPNAKRVCHVGVKVPFYYYLIVFILT